MRKIIQTMIVISMIGTCFAQTEDKKPAGVDKSDIIKKLDRSELQNDETEGLTNIITTFEIPEMGIINKPKVTKSKVENVKPIAKPEVESVVNSASKSPQVTIKEAEVEEVVVPKVVIVTNPITLNDLANNDKIVSINDNIYVYRLLGSVINQYQYDGELPLDSDALTVEGNDYYITDKDKLVSDALAKAQKSNTVAQEKTVNAKKTYVVTQKIRNQMKKVEGRMNSGFKIRSTIEIKELEKDDLIYLFDKVKLVIRNQEDSFKKKYWLMEEFNSNASFVEKLSKSKYRVLSDQ